MQKVGLKEKKCATCRWWQGNRQISFWAQKPFKVECDAKGDCSAVKAPRSYSISCSRWTAWEKLPANTRNGNALILIIVAIAIIVLITCLTRYTY